MKGRPESLGTRGLVASGGLVGVLSLLGAILRAGEAAAVGPGFWLLVPFWYLLGLAPGLWAGATFSHRLGAPARWLPLFGLPLAAWALPSALGGPGSTANAVVESLTLGAVASIALLVRVARYRDDRLAFRRFLLSVAAPCLVALGFAVFFPDLPS